MHTANAQKVTTSVPATSGSTPNCGLAKSGDHFVPVKNSPKLTSWKNSTVGGISETTMPTVVTTESIAHRNNSALMTFSP